MIRDAMSRLAGGWIFSADTAPEELQGFISRLVINSGLEDAEDIATIVQDCLGKMRLRRTTAEVRLIEEGIKNAAASGDDATLRQPPAPQAADHDRKGKRMKRFDEPEETYDAEAIGGEDPEAPAEEEEVVSPLPYEGEYEPVKVYLREMAHRPLLTREGEVKIARKIEKSRKELTCEVFLRPITLKKLLALGERVERGEAPITEVVIGVDDTSDEDMTEERGKLYKDTVRVGKLMEAYQKALKTLSASRAKTPSTNAADNAKTALFEGIKALNLKEEIVMSFSEDLKKEIIAALDLEADLKGLTRRLVSARIKPDTLKAVPAGIKSAETRAAAARYIECRRMLDAMCASLDLAPIGPEGRARRDRDRGVQHAGRQARADRGQPQARHKHSQAPHGQGPEPV